MLAWYDFDGKTDLVFSTVEQQPVGIVWEGERPHHRRGFSTYNDLACTSNQLLAPRIMLLWDVVFSREIIMLKQLLPREQDSQFCSSPFKLQYGLGQSSLLTLSGNCLVTENVELTLRKSGQSYYMYKTNNSLVPRSLLFFCLPYVSLSFQTTILNVSTTLLSLAMKTALLWAFIIVLFAEVTFLSLLKDDSKLNIFCMFTRCHNPYRQTTSQTVSRSVLSWRVLPKLYSLQ